MTISECGTPTFASVIKRSRSNSAKIKLYMKTEKSKTVGSGVSVVLDLCEHHACPPSYYFSLMLLAPLL